MCMLILYITSCYAQTKPIQENKFTPDKEQENIGITEIYFGMVTPAILRTESRVI